MCLSNFLKKKALDKKRKCCIINTMKFKERELIKKTISFVMIVNMLAAGLVGCGDVSDSSSAAATTKATTVSTTSESVSSTTTTTTTATTTETTTTKKTTTESKSKTTTTTKKTEAETTQQTKQVGGDNGYIEDNNDNGGHNYDDDYVEPAQTEAPKTTTQRKTEAATTTTTKATKKETTTTTYLYEPAIPLQNISAAGYDTSVIDYNYSDFYFTSVDIVGGDNIDISFDKYKIYAYSEKESRTDVRIKMEHPNGQTRTFNMTMIFE